MKRMLSFCLALALILTLCAGCHGAKRKDAFVIPDSFDTSKTYEITFWAKNDTNITQTNIYKKAIADFMALYPNIRVELKLYTDYGKIYNDVITNIPTSTTPNVCITYPDHIATYMTGDNTVVPLDKLFADPAYGLGGSELRFDGPDEGEIIEKFLSECKIGEDHYAIPFMRSTEACYINRDFVERLGYTVPDVLTWDFIFEVSEKAMEKDADGNFLVNGQKVMIPFIYKSTDNMMIQMLRQKGAGYSTDEGEILIFNETTEELLAAIAPHAGTGAFSTFKISSYPANLLNAGQCIFAIDSTAGATWMGSDAPLCDISEDKLVRFETVVRMIPQFETEAPQMISQGPSVCVFNKDDPQEVLASWLFAQYLLTNEVQIAYSQTEGYAPVTSKAQTSEAYLDYLSRAGEDSDLYYRVKLDATRLLLDNTENTFVTPVFNGSASLRNAAGQLIENVTKSMRRKEIVDDAYFDKLYADIRALYRLDQRNAMADGRAELGALPTMSKVLIGVLVGTWVLIGVYVGVQAMKKRKKQA
ncbi:MAG: carbohydrate ABC transporter substrate-binding protein [Clostridia bacterium]|nr:carbohydrate ABC transporter substrate-binding protein [Clostridia bacterium]